MENEDDEEVLETEISHQNVIQLLIEPTNEETKPEFDSGRQLMEWLGKRLEYIEVQVLIVLKSQFKSYIFK